MSIFSVNLVKTVQSTYSPRFASNHNFLNHNLNRSCLILYKLTDTKQVNFHKVKKKCSVLIFFILSTDKCPGLLKYVGRCDNTKRELVQNYNWGNKSRKARRDLEVLRAQTNACISQVIQVWLLKGDWLTFSSVCLNRVALCSQNLQVGRNQRFFFPNARHGGSYWSDDRKSEKRESKNKRLFLLKS